MLFCILIGRQELGETEMQIKLIIIILINVFNINSISRLDWDKNYFENNFLVKEIKNIFDLNLEIFSKDSLKILTLTLPIYFASKTMDQDMHKCFYRRANHENINQPSKSLCNFFYNSYVPLMVTTTAISLFSSNEHLRRTGEVYLAGVFSILGTKTIIKNGFELDCCKRPGNHNFDKHKESYGGFPSGHIAELVFLAGLYGSQFGIKIGAPLFAYTGVFWGLSVACNRHYFSQLVFGAILGSVYACAATKLVDKRLADKLAFSISNSSGNTNFSCSYTF